MSKERERYKRNRARVYDLYGIPKKERGRKYNMHHIVFRSDPKRNPKIFGNFDINKKANLYPLTKEKHQELHSRARETR